MTQKKWQASAQQGGLKNPKFIIEFKDMWIPWNFTKTNKKTYFFLSLGQNPIANL